MQTIFISRAGADNEFALWVAALVRAQGAKTILQDEDFGHQNFMGAMHDALDSGALVAALLTPAYLKSDYCIAEATQALTGDPLNKLKRLRVLRLENCAPTGVLANVAYTDLLPDRRQQDADALARKVLGALGFSDATLEGAPPPPAGTLTQKIPIRHPEIRENRTFAGRDALLLALKEQMRSGGGSNSGALTQAASGLGGVGKTVLAREFAWRNRDAYEGVWWIAAETEDGVVQGLVALGDKLMPGLAAEQDRQEAARKTLRWLENADYATPFLIIYDNVEDLACFDRWRPAAGAHVLITTRRTDLGGVVDQKIQVDAFEPEVAVDFLCRHGERDDRDAAARLVGDIGLSAARHRSGRRLLSA